MNNDNYEFTKVLASVVAVGLIAVLLLFLGIKAIDYHFPSKFDKLMHCNK